MRYLILVCVFILASSSIHAQEYYDLSGIQGLKNAEGEIFFEIGGYEISTTSLTAQVTDRAITDSLKIVYRFGTVIAEYSDPEITLENKILEAEQSVQNKAGEKINQVLYFIARDEGIMSVILLQTYNQRDIVLEQSFVDAFLEDQLQVHISDDWSAGTVNFAGQTLQLGTDCRWVKPHHIKCGDARMIWSEYLSYESALLDINTRIRVYSADNVNTVDESDVDVLFENMPVVAHRIVYTRTGVGDGEPLTACYYIVQEIDGRYVSCVLSNPIYNTNDYGLAPLLQQVMRIPELPDNAYKYIEEPERRVDEEEDDDSFYDITMFEVQAGTWLPVGKLNRAFKAAPMIGLYVGFPIKKKMAIDLGFQIGLPVDKKMFDYYEHKKSYKTEAELMLNIALRWRQQRELARNVSLSTYIGLGANIIRTDLLKEYYDDDYDKYETIETLDLFGGASIRHKIFGAFIEYHYTPYSIGNKVKGHFGNSAINLGLTFSFISM